MSYEVQRYSGHWLPDRRISRTISALEVRTLLRRAEIRAEEQVLMEKMESVTAVTRAAVDAVTEIAIAVRSREHVAPEASNEYAGIQALHGLVVESMITDHSRNIRFR